MVRLCHRAAFGCVVVGLAALVAGCSSEKPQVVSGTVTLDGTPLTGGVIQFYGPGDRLSTARIESDGKFAATDVMPGDSIQVAIVPDPDAAMGQMASAPGSQAMPGTGDKKAAKAASVPAKYRSFKTSGLSYTISKSEPTIEVKLVSK